LVHVLCILTHFGMTIAAAIGYIYNHDQDRVTGLSDWSYLTTANVKPCHFALSGGLKHRATADMTARTLLVACLGVVSSVLITPSHPTQPCINSDYTPPSSFAFSQGTIGLGLNVILFALLLATEINNITLTEGEQYWRRQVVTLFGCVLNLLLAGAGVGLALTLGTKEAGSRLLIAPLIWASIQAYV
jgi:hypothetical protein